MDIVERLAQQAAETINGGEFYDGKWYTEGQRQAWRKAMAPAADEIERLRLALHTISSVDADVIVPERMWSEMTPLDCYEEGLMNGAMAVRDAVKTEAYAVLALGEKE
jgi:hypothetical protein